MLTSEFLDLKKELDHTYEYNIYTLDHACGVLYTTKKSPNFISGHVRMLGKKGGQYPYNYKAMIYELFGDVELQLEVCSGSVTHHFIDTVDINPAKNPKYVMDATKLPQEWSNKYDRWFCDPPYNHNTAKNMYNVKFPSIPKLLKEGARVVKPGSYLFLLLGPTNMQICPKPLKRVGLIMISIIPLQELRALNIYEKITS